MAGLPSSTARVSRSRNSQIVRASGTRSPSASPRKRMNDSRSLIEVLRALVREAVRGLDHQDLEHHHRIERWPPALRPVRVGQRRIERRAEHLEVHRRRERLQLIAQIAEPLQAIIDVEETGLPDHPALLTNITQEHDPGHQSPGRFFEPSRCRPRPHQFVGGSYTASFRPRSATRAARSESRARSPRSGRSCARRTSAERVIGNATRNVRNASLVAERLTACKATVFPLHSCLPLPLGCLFVPPRC